MVRLRKKEQDALFAPGNGGIHRLAAGNSENVLEIIADHLNPMVVMWEQEREKLK